MPVTDKTQKAAGEQIFTGKLNDRQNFLRRADPEDLKNYHDIKGPGANARKQAFRDLYIIDHPLKFAKTVKHEASVEEETDEMDGVYHPFGVIVREEGGDEDAVTAAKNIVAKCLRRKGRWCMFNTESERMEFLYLKKKWRSKFMRSKGLTTSGELEEALLIASESVTDLSNNIPPGEVEKMLAKLGSGSSSGVPSTSVISTAAPTASSGSSIDTASVSSLAGSGIASMTTSVVGAPAAVVDAPAAAIGAAPAAAVSAAPAAVVAAPAAAAAAIVVAPIAVVDAPAAAIGAAPAAAIVAKPVAVVAAPAAPAAAIVAKPAAVVAAPAAAIDAQPAAAIAKPTAASMHNLTPVKLEPGDTHAKAGDTAEGDTGVKTEETGDKKRKRDPFVTDFNQVVAEATYLNCFKYVLDDFHFSNFVQSCSKPNKYKIIKIEHTMNI